MKKEVKTYLDANGNGYILYQIQNQGGFATYTAEYIQNNQVVQDYHFEPRLDLSQVEAQARMIYELGKPNLPSC